MYSTTVLYDKNLKHYPAYMIWILSYIMVRHYVRSNCNNTNCFWGVRISNVWNKGWTSNIFQPKLHGFMYKYVYILFVFRAYKWTLAKLICVFKQHLHFPLWTMPWWFVMVTRSIYFTLLIIMDTCLLNYFTCVYINGLSGNIGK